MKLYRNATYPNHWFVFDPSDGWMIFAAETAGWLKRQPTTQDRLGEVREVPLWLAFNTGLPGTAGTADRGLRFELGRAA